MEDTGTTAVLRKFRTQNFTNIKPVSRPLHMSLTTLDNTKTNRSSARVDGQAGGESTVEIGQVSCLYP
jgi:hypothetical protein